MKYKPLSPELYQHNRKRFVREMKPGTVAIFNSNDQMPRSGDQYFPFRQNAGLFYLSGIDQEETVLKRLEAYDAQTAAVLPYYQSRGLLQRIDGNGTPTEVGVRISEALSKSG